jgi:magnesium-transporting ATPase (P-type)
VRSADYSIGQFRFLEKLLLNYGRIGYLKISKFICYYFYKNILLVYSDILYGFSNGFSGQLYFADYLTTMYNAIFTSWCCLFVFSLERDVDLYIVKKFPMLYAAGQKNYFFNLKIFWSYILYAILHGTICYFLPELTLKDTYDDSGKTLNHWYKSTVNFSLIIHVVSYKLLIISDFWNWVNLSAFFLSIALYYIVVFVLCTDKLAFTLQNELANVLQNLFKDLKFWLLMIFGPFLATIIDITIKQISYSAFPIPTNYIKQHMNDITFKSIVFNDEDNDKHYASAEAKMAEKKIKEILKKARELKKKRLIEKRNQNGIPKNIGSPNKKLLDTSVIVVNSPVL